MKKKTSTISKYIFIFVFFIGGAFIFKEFILDGACGCVIPMGYEISWGKVYYHPKGGFAENTKVLNHVDYSTFQIIDEIYAKDKNYLYIEGSAHKDMDVQTVKILEYPYIKDKDHVYYYGEIIPEADPRTFQAIKQHFAKDANNVFYGTERLGADPKSFQFIDMYYAKDINNIFYFSPVNNKKQNTKIEGADSKTFQVFEEFGPPYEYSKDKKHVYKQGKILPNADAETFEFINAFYMKDKNHIYYEGNLLKEADVNTFEISTQSSYDGKDKNYYFSKGKIKLP